jgi:hypothetical protein
MCVRLQDMHTLAYRTILEGLSAGGLVKGDVDAMLKDDVAALFMPHGKAMSIDNAAGTYTSCCSRNIHMQE